MKTSLKKTLFVVLLLTGLVVTSLAACSHRGHSYSHRSAAHEGFSGQAHSYGDYTNSHQGSHQDEHERDSHGRRRYNHGY